MKKVRRKRSSLKSRNRVTKEAPTQSEILSEINLNAAGIDVGSKEQWVAVPKGRDAQAVQSFGSFTSDLHRIANWLEQCGVDTVAMESTGVYWIPIFDILEQRGFKVVLVNAEDFKNVPGRKTDVSDCQWLQQLHTFGLLRASFRPTAEFVALRAFLRHRQTLVESAGSVIQRMQKALTQMNIQLHNVIRDISGKTGMNIIRSIISGNHDPKKLAEHRDYRCKASKRDIIESLTGNYKPEHIHSLRQNVDAYDLFQRLIQETDDRTEKKLEQIKENSPKDTSDGPEQKKQPRVGGNEPSFDIRAPLFAITGTDLTKIPGIGPYSALKIISEIGTDMTRWPNAKEFSAWATLAPRNKITGGRVISSKTRSSANRVAGILRMSAQALGRTDTYPGAFYRRKAATIGKAKAITATGRKLAVLIYTLLSKGLSYREPGAGSYERKFRTRSLKHLTNRAKNLGYRLVQVEPEAEVA